ncbi:MAG: hypothetical protein ABR538_03255 [Candidatus Binatia bacterium]
MLFVLIALVGVAAIWVLAPTNGQGPASLEEAAVDSCAEDVACSAGIGDQMADSDASAIGDGEAAPAAESLVETPGAGQPAADLAADAGTVSAADAVRLREEADRLLAEGRVPDGIEALRKATEADPSARNHGDLGALLQRLTAFDEAARHLQRAAELDPTSADRWIALANVYYQAVNPGEAWKAERRAREAEPGLQLGRDASGMRIRKGDSAGAQP